MHESTYFDGSLRHKEATSHQLQAGCVRLKSLEPKEVACTEMAAVKQNIIIIPSLNEI